MFELNRIFEETVNFALLHFNDVLKEKDYVKFCDKLLQAIGSKYPPDILNRDLMVTDLKLNKNFGKIGVVAIMEISTLETSGRDDTIKIPRVFKVHQKERKSLYIQEVGVDKPPDIDRIERFWSGTLEMQPMSEPTGQIFTISPRFYNPEGV